jgi:hypothetical protein
MNYVCDNLPLIAALLAVVSGASYLFAAEGIRGAGRVVGGFVFNVLAFYFGFIVAPALYVVALMFAAAGLVTVVCGVRKFMRR